MLSRVSSNALTSVVVAAVLAVLMIAPAAPTHASTGERLSGSNRYETSAAVSEAGFPRGAHIVYIAAGDDFPDALAGGPAASLSAGPILLVSPEGVPSAVKNELSRLQPARIVILGGTAAVPAAIAESLRTYAPSVDRIAGGNRYETASAISRETFQAGVDLVYLANGQNFPDSVTAGAVAGRDGAPIVLVTPESIPAASAAELDRLAPRRMVVLGGSAAVGDDVVEQARRLTGTDRVSRLSGHDRYGTAAAVSAASFDPRVDAVFVATGTTFPDALTAGPLASTSQAPILLVPKAGVPVSVTQEIRRLQPSRIIVLGSEGAVDPAVLSAVTSSATGETPSAPDIHGLASYDAQILGLLNAERAKHGLPALKASEPMRRTSQANSAEMALTGFAHDSNAEIQSEIYAAGCRYNWRENIHYTDGRWTNQVLMDPSNPVRYWMASKKGHREAILHPNMRYAGMGSVVDGNKVYNTLRLAENCS